MHFKLYKLLNEALMLLDGDSTPDLDNINVKPAQINNEDISFYGLKKLIERIINNEKIELTDIEKDTINAVNQAGNNIKEYYYPKSPIELSKVLQHAIPYFGNDGNYNWIGTGMLTSLTATFRSFPNFNGNISNWDVSHVTNMNFTFFGCKSLTCDISNWDLGAVKFATSCVKGCNEMFKQLIKEKLLNSKSFKKSSVLSIS